MKKLFYLFAAAALVVAGCDKNPVTGPEYGITINAGTGGNATASAASAAEGAEITITATPDAGYEFMRWTITGAQLADATANPAKFIMPAGNVTVTAEFKKEGAFGILVTAGTGGKAAATLDGAAVTSAQAGADISLTATADPGYEFVRWNATGVTLSAPTAALTTFEMPAGDVAIDAEFKEMSANSFKITVTTSPEGFGTAQAMVNGQSVSTAVAGEQVTIIASPNEGYEFVKWLITRATLTNDMANPATFTMPDGNVNAMAQFKTAGASPEGVELNGVVWARHNVNTPGTLADTPEDFGMFYKWNSRVGWSSTDPIVSTDGSTWELGGYTGTAEEWEAANDPCPTGWRLPKVADVEKLLDQNKVATKYEGASDTRPIGRTFTDVVSNESIYIPYAGDRVPNGVIAGRGSEGLFWIADASSATQSYYAIFVYTPVGILQLDRTFALNVRCVQK
jgi:uncharacterized protein (TIGR02145 family)